MLSQKIVFCKIWFRYLCWKWGGLQLCRQPYLESWSPPHFKVPSSPWPDPAVDFFVLPQSLRRFAIDSWNLVYVCHILSRSHFEYMKTKCRQTIDPLAVLEYTIQKFLTQAVDYALLMLWEKLLCHIKETFSAWFSWTAFKLRPLQPTIRMQHQPGRMVVWAPLLGVLCMQSNVSQIIVWQQLIIYERTKLQKTTSSSIFKKSVGLLRLLTVFGKSVKYLLCKLDKTQNVFHHSAYCWWSEKLCKNDVDIFRSLLIWIMNVIRSAVTKIFS